MAFTGYDDKRPIGGLCTCKVVTICCGRFNSLLWFYDAEYNEGDRINCCVMEVRQDGTATVSLASLDLTPLPAIYSTLVLFTYNHSWLHFLLTNLSSNALAFLVHSTAIRYKLILQILHKWDHVILSNTITTRIPYWVLRQPGC